jgi:hypothetical protein
MNNLTNTAFRHARFLMLNSSDGYGTPTNFTISLGNTEGAQERILQVVPRTLALLNTFYNVTTYTNRLHMRINGIEVTTTIPLGRYSLQQFQDFLNTTFIALATFTLSPLKDGNISSQCSVTHKYFADSTFSKIFGLKSDTAEATTISTNSVANFIYPSVIVCRADFAHGQTIVSTGTNQNIFDIVENEVPFGAMLSHTHNDIDIHSMEFPDQRSFSSIQIRLTDRENNTLECAPGTNHSFIFKLFYV